MDAQTLFNTAMPKTLAHKPQKAREVGAIFLFKVTGAKGGIWTVDLKSDPPKITQGETTAADCTVEMSDEDFEAAFGDMQVAMGLMFSGQIKITGDPMLATKLQAVFQG